MRHTGRVKKMSKIFPKMSEYVFLSITTYNSPPSQSPSSLSVLCNRSGLLDVCVVTIEDFRISRRHTSVQSRPKTTLNLGKGTRKKGTFREYRRTPPRPEGRFKTWHGLFVCGDPGALTTRRSIFLAAALFFDIFQDLPVSFVRLFVPPHFPVAVVLCFRREVKASRAGVLLPFFRNAINDARFPFGWPSGGKRRASGLSSLFLRGVSLLMDRRYEVRRRLAGHKSKERKRERDYRGREREWRKFRSSLPVYLPPARD